MKYILTFEANLDTDGLNKDVPLYTFVQFLLNEQQIDIDDMDLVNVEESDL